MPTKERIGAESNYAADLPHDCCMNAADPILFRELPLIRKIIQDEIWLEGERRGCHVDPRDPIVLENVCRVVLRVGQDLRDSLGQFD